METINKYIESKKHAWSPNTLKSEKLRLSSVADLLQRTSSPQKLYEALQPKYSPYSLKTIFIRVAEFKAFCGDASYKEFMKSHARLFKNAYTTKPVGMSFDEAKAKIQKLQDKDVKKVAELMISTGLRVHEALKYDGSGEVVGKGLKKRPVFSSEKVSVEISYSKIRKHLAAVGLCSHDLRKLAATRLAESGIRNIDLMEVMGWSSMETASRYLQSSDKRVLEAKVKQVLQGATTNERV